MADAKAGAPVNNQNAFKHGLAALGQHRLKGDANGALTPAEQSVREEILAGLVADKAALIAYLPASTCWLRLSPQMPLC
jgi:hypothetical protein